MEHSYLLQVLSVALTLALAAGLMVIIAVAVSPLVSTAELMALPSAQHSTPPLPAERSPLVITGLTSDQELLGAAYRDPRLWETELMPNAGIGTADRERRVGRSAAEPVRENA